MGERQKVAYGPYGNDEVAKELHGMLLDALRAEFPEDILLPEGPVNQYFTGETRPGNLAESIANVNELDLEATKKSLHTALRNWIDYGRQQIQRRRMGEYYNPETLKK